MLAGEHVAARISISAAPCVRRAINFALSDDRWILIKEQSWMSAWEVEEVGVGGEVRELFGNYLIYYAVWVLFRWFHIGLEYRASTMDEETVAKGK
jgi:hypothetical protein